MVVPVNPECQNSKTNNPPPGCKPDIPGLIGAFSAVGFFALTIALFLLHRRWRKNRALAAQREGVNAAEAAETTPQAALQPRIRVRVTEAFLPQIDRVDTLPLYDPDVVGARLSQSSAAVIAGHDYFNNHRRILLDPEGNLLDDSPAGTAHEKGTEFSSPPFKPLQVLTSSGAPLDPPPDFRDESVSVRRTEQSEPPPAYPPPVYSVGSRPVG